MSLPKAIFISHGGGPLPLLGDPEHNEMVSCLQDIASSFPKPDAVIVVSAHWEETIPTVTGINQPTLIYDYYGFPPESYQIQYPCPSEPALAHELYRVLNAAGVDASVDQTRGLDHGVFVPMKIMYPEADIPCVQLSLIKTLDASAHIKLGEALAGIDWTNLLILGSGFSFHNLRAFFRPPTTDHCRQNEAFEDWLEGVCTSTILSEADRREKLINWSLAPGARYCHPREEHLLPLHVCYGMVQSAAVERYEVRVMNSKCSMYLW